MVRIAVFASGTGSNYEAIMKYADQLAVPDIQISLLVCDQPQAGAIAKAQQWQTPVFLVQRRQFADKKAFEQHILLRLKEDKIEFIALAGYMRLIGPTLLNEYYGRIINLHPSLLPTFPGLDAVGQALSAGVKVTGVTVHFVDAGMDTGPIIAQQAVTVDDCDDHESLSRKIHAVEHDLYPRIVHQCATGQIYLDQGRVCSRVLSSLRSSEE
ncbi:MAG: phosphoribosylglycinamide formyltransferase [Bacillota bacterium]|nr:phosphoribosylglycinamide formyltransferase [Bacillota bacterium]